MKKLIKSDCPEESTVMNGDIERLYVFLQKLRWSNQSVLLRRLSINNKVDRIACVQIGKSTVSTVLVGCTVLPEQQAMRHPAYGTRRVGGQLRLLCIVRGSGYGCNR